MFFYEIINGDSTQKLFKYIYFQNQFHLIMKFCLHYLTGVYYKFTQQTKRDAKREINDDLDYESNNV